MRGRPKGTIKEDKKKLKTFRLSSYEEEVVTQILKLIRGKIEEFDSREFSFLTENIYLQAKSSVIFNEDDNKIDYSNPTVLYAVNFNAKYGTFISKCPIISSTNFTYKIKNINDENTITYTKVNKRDIDNHSIYYTQHHLALAKFLETQKTFILRSIIEMDNPIINKQFLKIVSSHGIYPALEYGAELLDMKEIFEFKDYTVEI